jgi:hypothetical protein
VTSRYQHPISTLIERIENECHIDTTCAVHTDNPNIRRHLHTGSASKIRSGIAAPIAAEGDDIGFKGFGLL